MTENFTPLRDLHTVRHHHYHDQNTKLTHDQLLEVEALVTQALDTHEKVDHKHVHHINYFNAEPDEERTKND